MRASIRNIQKLISLASSVTLMTTSCTDTPKKSKARKPQPTSNNPTTDPVYPAPIVNDPVKQEAETVATLRAKLKSGAWNNEHLSYDIKKIQTYAYTFNDTHITLLSNCSFYLDGTFKFVTATAPYTLTSQSLTIDSPAAGSVTYKDTACEARLENLTWQLKLDGQNLMLSTPNQALNLKQITL